MCKKLDWHKMGMKINGSFLNNLRLAKAIHDIQMMLSQFNEKFQISRTEDAPDTDKNYDKNRRLQSH